MLNSKLGLTGLLVLVFLANVVETAAESWIGPWRRFGAEYGTLAANAVHWFEREFIFEFHDVTNNVAVFGYGISYFFLFPLLGLAVAAVLAWRSDIAPYKVLSLAVAIDYLVSLPFFLLFPVPERWAYPESGAMLLADRLSPKLIEWIRPVSGLDNCFPSTHVSLTVILILVCYLFQVRFRACVLALGLTVILSTFVLGIHWMADMTAGLAAGVISVLAARRLATK